MKEQGVPCAVDFRKNCSSTCVLYKVAEEQMNEIIAITGDANSAELLREGLCEIDQEEVGLFVSGIMGMYEEDDDLKLCEQFQKITYRNSEG